MGKTINRLNVGDRVKRVAVKNGSSPYLNALGTIEALETELGPDYCSVRWDGNTSAFCGTVPKENLVKVD